MSEQQWKPATTEDLGEWAEELGAELLIDTTGSEVLQMVVLAHPYWSLHPRRDFSQ